MPLSEKSSPHLPLVVGLVALVFQFGFVGLILANHRWNPMVFVYEGSQISQKNPDGTLGYDGQFVYYIARDPLNAAEFLTPPAHRYRRILLPMLAWGISLGGQPLLLPWVMVLTNCAAGAASVTLLAQLLARRGAKPWYALTLMAYIGFVFSLRANLNELLAVALALGGWLAYERSRLGVAVLLFGLAGLAKEMGLVIPLGLAAWELLNRRWRPALLLAGSSTPYLFWSIFLNIKYGAASHLLTPTFIPFAGFQYLTEPISRIVVSLWVLLPAIAGSVWALLDLRRLPQRSRAGHLIFLVLANTVLIATLPQFTWPDPLAMFRTALGLVAVVLVWLAAYHPRLLPAAAILWALSGILLIMAPGML